MKNRFCRHIMLGVLSVCILAGAVVPVRGQSPLEYAQNELMLVDRDGDRFLARLFWATCETGIKKCLLFKNVPPQQTQLRLPRFLQENPIVAIAEEPFTDNSQVRPAFEAEKVFLNLRKIILAEERKGLIASVGEKHVWAEKRKSGLSKILVALATASSSRFLYVGQEENLIEWIKNRPDRSVTIEELFRQSYILNQGNVYLTILTIENVLSDATFEADRENTLVNQKLADLYVASPNKFGDWYHFFGTMLAGYVGEPAHLIVRLYSIYRKVTRGKSAEKATLAADKAGADIGAKLRTFMNQGPGLARARLIADLQERNWDSYTYVSRPAPLSKVDRLYVAPAHKIPLD